MVPAFDAGLTRFRASRPHRSGMVIDSPHGCLGVRPASKAGTMGNQTKVLVTGAGGFIGHHLVSYLKSLGYWVRGADAKAPEFCANAADEFKLVDLRRWEDCLAAATGIDEVYALAADMGGMGFISAHHAQILYNNSIINLHTLEAARQSGVKRYLYTSSACVY